MWQMSVFNITTPDYYKHNWHNLFVFFKSFCQRPHGKLLKSQHKVIMGYIRNIQVKDRIQYESLQLESQAIQEE